MKKDMTSGREWKLILLFTLPIMAGNLLQQLYNTVDGIVVGNFVGESAFSSVGTCNPLTFLFLSIAMGLSIGAGVVVSQYFGAQMHKELSVAVDTSLILMAAVGVLISALAFVISPWLLHTVLGVPDDILAEAVIYFRIYSCGLVFQFLYNSIAAVLRSVGDSKATLYFLIVSATVNVVLDLLFVIVFHWGVAGAAVATVIAQMACAAVSYIYLRKRFPRTTGLRAFDPKTCRLILKLGVPAAIQQSIVAFGNVAVSRLINSFGNVSIAAYSAGNRIDSFVFVPIMGFQTGLATFTGQNIGAGKLDRVKRGMLATFIMLLGTVFVIGLLLYFFAAPVISFFGLSGASLIRGVEQVRFLSFAFLLFACNMCFAGVLQGSGDVVIQSVATLSALTVRVLVGYLGVHFGILGFNAAWIPTPIGWSFAFVISVARYLSGKWKTKAVARRVSGEDGGAIPDEI